MAYHYFKSSAGLHSLCAYTYQVAFWFHSIPVLLSTPVLIFHILGQMFQWTSIYTKGMVPFVKSNLIRTFFQVFHKCI